LSFASGPRLRRVRRFLRRSPRRAFTHVVPLGLSCRVTYQVRAYFGTGIAYPFDWWISPLAGLTEYLADLDPRRIYAPEALEELVENGRVTAIQTRESGIQLFHELPRYRDASDVSVVSPGWQGHLAAAAEKHTHRLKRLKALNRKGNRILFVRHKRDVEPQPENDEDAEDDPSPLIARLWDTLRGQWSEAEVHLLLINLPGASRPVDRVLSLHFDDPPGPPPESWRGETARWTAALSSLGLAPLNASEPGMGHPSPPD